MKSTTFTDERIDQTRRYNLKNTLRYQTVQISRDDYDMEAK